MSLVYYSPCGAHRHQLARQTVIRDFSPRRQGHLFIGGEVPLAEGYGTLLYAKKWVEKVNSVLQTAQTEGVELTAQGAYNEN